MREIRTSGSMSGDGKRNDAYDTKIETAPVLESTAVVVKLYFLLPARGAS